MRATSAAARRSAVLGGHVCRNRETPNVATTWSSQTGPGRHSAPSRHGARPLAGVAASPHDEEAMQRYDTSRVSHCAPLHRIHAILRRYPPVHSAVPLPALAAAAAAIPAGRNHPEALATDAVAKCYPGRSIRLTASGTQALQLALECSADPRRGKRRIALPAFACPDLGTAAIGADADVLLYDLDPHTLAPDWLSVERVLQQGCTHIVAAHYLGRLVDVPRMRRLAETAGAIVVDDAAQHAGATLDGVRGGALGAWGVLSFGRGKGLNAGGGGALLAPPDAPALSRISLSTSSAARAVADLAKVIATSCLSHPLLYWLPSSVPALELGATHYHPPVPPTQATLSQMALLPFAFQAESQALQQRRAAAQHYAHALADRDELLFAPPLDAANSGALRFPIRLSREAAHALAPYGVVRSYPRLLDAYPPIRDRMVGEREPLPGASLLSETVHTLPTHALMSSATRERLIDRLRALTPRSSRR